MKTERLTGHSGLSEKSIERYLRDRVTEMGGACLKYSNQGMAGYPDRICLLPGGVTLWVELKGAGGRLSALQEIRIRQLERMGHKAYVCRSREEVDRLLGPYREDRP